MRPGFFVVVSVLVLAPVLAGSVMADETAAAASEIVDVQLRPMPDGVKKMRIEQAEDGSYAVVVTHVDDREERLRPDEFIARIDRDTRGRRFLFRLLNITSPVGIAWVLLGFFGQLIFAGRMVLQWIVSERQKRSVVPVGFWWMSLVGASMVLVYFVWRRDIIGVLGQSMGWVIYVRNLWLIYLERRTA